MASLATVTAFVSDTAYFVYLGQADLADSQKIANIDIVVNVTTAFATGGVTPWAEVAIFSSTGNFPTFANGSLTRRGSTDVSGTFNATGVKKTTVAVSGITPGMHLWAAFGSKGTTPYQVRGALADDLQSGAVQTVAAPAKLSTLSSPQATVLGGAALVPPNAWVGCR